MMIELEGALREHSCFTSTQTEFQRVPPAFQNYQIEIVTLEYGAAPFQERIWKREID